MLRKQALIALAALGIGADASGVAAQAMYGSDTLFNVTRDLVANAVTAGAVGAGKIDYKGTGSGQGGKAMNGGDTVAVPVIPAQNQQISPQSRFLSDAECGSAISKGPGQGLEIGLDAIGLFRSTLGTTPATNCNTLRYTNAGGDGAALTGFTFDDWRDVARVVYAGVFPGAKPTANPCTEAAPARSAVTAVAPGRCDATARKELIANWGKLFQEGNCSTGNCPTGLRHAWRRDDVSGTTDVFTTLLGLPAPTVAANKPFCNGTDTEDIDPIRTPCSDQEQVCGNIPYANRGANANGGTTVTAATNPAAVGGDLGVVQAVTLPTDPTKQYSANACGLGRFSFAAMPSVIQTAVQKCPDGNSRVFNLCRYPISSLATGSQFGCNAVKTTAPPNRTLLNIDGRAFNLVPRDPTTGALLIAPASGVDPRWGGGGVYKIHQSAVMANAGAAVICKQADATEQIGCLTQADPCSIGYAGRGAANWNGTEANSNVVALNVRTPAGAGTNNATDEAAILRLDSAQGGTAPTCSSNFGERYSLSRTLWINASKGFGQTAGGVKNFPSITDTGNPAGGPGDENKFLTWVVANKGTATTGLDAVLTKYDFIPTTLRTFQCASASAANPPTALNTLP